MHDAHAAAIPRRPALLGPWGPPQRACLRSWRRLGLDPVFVHVGRRDLWPRPVADTCRLERLDDLARMLSAAGADGVTALGAAERRLLTAGDPGIERWLPPPRACMVLDSRARQIALAHLVGLDVPPTFSVGAGGVGVPAERFPVVARNDDPVAAPAMAAASRDALARMVDSRHLRPMIVQPLLHGPRVTVLGARGRSGAVFGLEAFVAPRTFRGRPLSLRATALPPALMARCVALVEAAEVIGPFSVSFVRSGGTHWFIGLAAGMGDSAAMALGLGYDAPRHLLAAHDVLPRVRAGPLSPRAVVARPALLGHLAAVLTGRTTPLDHPPVHPLRAMAEDLADLATGRGVSVDLRDLRGSLAGWRSCLC